MRFLPPALIFAGLLFSGCIGTDDSAVAQEPSQVLIDKDGEMWFDPEVVAPGMEESWVLETVATGPGTVAYNVTISTGLEDCRFCMVTEMRVLHEDGSVDVLPSAWLVSSDFSPVFASGEDADIELLEGDRLVVALTPHSTMGLFGGQYKVKVQEESLPYRITGWMEQSGDDQL